jgi:hypothetical protein
VGTHLFSRYIILSGCFSFIDLLGMFVFLFEVPAGVEKLSHRTDHPYGNPENDGACFRHFKVVRQQANPKHEHERTDGIDCVHRPEFCAVGMIIFRFVIVGVIFALVGIDRWILCKKEMALGIDIPGRAHKIDARPQDQLDRKKAEQETDD